jgi:lipopolysaccharide export system permease protein
MILERYIQREILARLGWILTFLLAILASDRFVEYLADAAAGDLPPNLILQMLLMKMLSMLPRLLPITLLLGVILALARMTQDRELTVVSSAGVPEAFKIKSILKISAVFAALVLLVSFYLSPWAEWQVRELTRRAEAESDITGIAAGQFREFSKGDMVVYVEQLNRLEQSMGNVFLQVRQDGKLGVLNSAGARLHMKPESGSRYVLFENGSRYIGDPGSVDYQMTRYRTYAVLLEQGEREGDPGWMETMPTSTLLRSDQASYHAELQWRISFVISTLLLPLLAFAVNRYATRDSRYVPVFICILIYLIYSNLLGLSRTLLQRGEVPGYVGLWWVHLLLVLTIFVLLNIPSLRSWYHRRYRRGTPA